MDTAHSMILNPIFLLQVRVQLHLMSIWDMSCVVQQGVELGRRKVGDANASSLPRLNELYHGFPGIEEVYLIFPLFSFGYWPMHVVQVQIVEAEVG